MKTFTEELIEAVYAEMISKRVVAIYPGRFQPPGPHHFETYKWLTNKFGKDNVYISTTDVVNEKSPLNFIEKKQVWMKYGVPSDKIVQVKNPYVSAEILDMLEDGTSVVIGLGTKDASRITFGKKKDGSPTFLQDFDKNRNNLQDFLQHAYVLKLPHVSTKIDGKEMSGTEIRNLISSDPSPEMFKKIFGWYDPKIHELLVKKFKTSAVNENLLLEGGHLFGADPIEQQYIKSTTLKYFDELKRLFPKKSSVFTYNAENLLGSAFKKDSSSGDVDIAFDVKQFYAGEISDWNLDPKVVESKVKELLSRAINYKKAVKSGDRKAIDYYLLLKQQEAINILISEYINTHSEIIVTMPKKAKAAMIMTSIPQFDSRGQIVKDPTTGNELLAQIDLNIGNMDWLKFSSYSADYRRNMANLSDELKSVYGSFDKLKHKSDIKGAHRTQLLLSMFEFLGYSFSHQEGVKDKVTGQILATNSTDALKVLNQAFNLNGKLTREIVDNYHLLHKFIKENLSEKDYNAIIDIYLKQRLESQRLDIPSDLVDYWKANKDRLGLTGKFNQNMQPLDESGVAGGHRIAKLDVVNTVEDYLDRVVKPKFGDLPYKIAGSFNLGTKNDHGDVDLLLKFDSKTKEEAKLNLEKYLKSLPDDIIIPFVSEKYKGRKLYKSGEIISILYPIKGKPGEAVQIDNIISIDEQEQTFKFEFLKLPAENQGLILGLVKTALIDNQELVAKIKSQYGNITDSQEYEYNLSSDGLTLRLITYDPEKLKVGTYSEIKRDVVTKTSNWSEIEKILPHYNLNVSFDDLLKQIQAKASPRAKRRIAGVFKSMITAKSGEEGTPKGDNKEIARKKVDSILH